MVENFGYTESICIMWGVEPKLFFFYNSQHLLSLLQSLKDKSTKFLDYTVYTCIKNTLFLLLCILYNWFEKASYYLLIIFTKYIKSFFIFFLLNLNIIFSLFLIILMIMMLIWTIFKRLTTVAKVLFMLFSKLDMINTFSCCFCLIDIRTMILLS